MIQNIRESLKHPFWQAIYLLVLSYLLFTVGIAYIPPLLGIRSAPVPTSVVLQYMITALVGILLYVSNNEERWTKFKEPINAALVDADKRWIRAAALVIVPLLIGYVTYDSVRPTVAAPLQLRSIHPAPPTLIDFRGRTIRLTGLENPLSFGTL